MELLIRFFSNEHFYNVIGMLGAGLYIGSYSAVQFGKLDGNSIHYCVWNGTAASLVLVSLYHDFNLSAATIQIVWVAVSIYGALKYWKNKRDNLAFSPLRE